MARTNSEDSRASNLSLISARLGQLRRDLVADYNMALDGPMSLFLDPNGADRTIRLPPLEAGLLVFIYHIGTANVLNVVDDSLNPVSYVEARQLVILESSEEEWASLGHNFRASGANHSEGLVPDPGPVAGSSRFLREDGIWAGSGAGIVSDAYSFMTDGTNTAIGTGLDTFKFRSSDNTLSLTVTNNDFTHGDNLNLTVNEANVDHNLLLNYVADQHVVHTGVVLTAGVGLAGGGDISASRTFNLDLNDLTADTPVLSDTFAFYDVSGADTNKATLTILNSILDHDALINFVLNEHVDHSLVAIQAGMGLSGGGDITATRTLNVDINGQAFETPVAGDLLMFHDVSGGDINKMTITTLSTVIDHDTTLNFVANEHIDHSAVSINTAANSGLAGGGNITASRSLSLDINNLTADTPVIGDSLAFFDLSGGDTNKTTFTTLNGILVHNSLSGYVANEHVNHTSVTLTAGAGLTGGGDISASRSFAVGAGTGITVNADDVALNVNGLTTDTPTAGDFFPFHDTSGGDVNKAAATGTGNVVLATSPQFTTDIRPSANDGASLGISGTAWSDAFFAAGGVLNWNAGAFTVTEVSGRLDISGGWSFTGDISPAQITANQNDYAPTGFASATVLRLSSDATRTITGLAGGSGGRIIFIHNVGAQSIVLADEDASSAAGNRFALSAAVTIAADQCCLLQYDSTSSRWRMVAGPAAAGGGSGDMTKAVYDSNDDGIFAVAQGGTGSATASGARTNLGVPYGKQSIWVPAGAMTTRGTNGAAGQTIEMTTNKNMVKTLNFDSATQEFAQFDIRMPKSWDEGTVTFIPVWSHAATATNFGVVWGLDAVAVSNDDALDVAFGTAQTSADTGGTTNDSYQGPESSAITIAGTPAAEDLVLFRIHRDPANGSDTMAIDARLHGVLILYTNDTTSDT